MIFSLFHLFTFSPFHSFTHSPFHPFTLSLFHLYLFSLIVKHLPISLMGIQLHLRFREVGTVVGIHHLQIILARLTLGQEEWLRHPSLVIDTGEIEFSIHTVFALTTKHKPTAVLAPVVEALTLLAVH